MACTKLPIFVIFSICPILPHALNNKKVNAEDLC